MPRRLKNLRISEVSTVDRGAGEGVRILLMKRAGSKLTAEQALHESIQSILADATVIDKSAAVAETVAEYNEFIAKDDPMPLPKTEEEMNKLIADAVAKGIKDATPTLLKAATDETDKLKAEMALLKMSEPHKVFMDKAKLSDEIKKSFIGMDGAARDTFIKANPLPLDPATEIEKAIAKALDPVLAQNAELKKKVDSHENAVAIESFKKRAVAAGLKEEDGETMRKAYSGDAAAQTALEKRFDEVKKAADEAIRVGRVFGEFGTTKAVAGSPQAALEAKADELRKADPKLTKDQAYTKAFADNPDLAQQVRADELKKIAA